MRTTAAAVFAVAVTFTLAGAPIACADESMYLNQVANTLSVYLTPSQALKLGNVACKAVHSATANGMTLGKARAAADDDLGADASGAKAHCLQAHPGSGLVFWERLPVAADA